MKVLAVRSPRSSHKGVNVSDREEKNAKSFNMPSVTFVDLPTALAQSDFVSLHVPLTSETYHLIGETEIHSMKRSSILINTARGAVVDSSALSKALQDGTIAGAALDVTDPEPLPTSDPLLTLPNFLVIPH